MQRYFKQRKTRKGKVGTSRTRSKSTRKRKTAKRRKSTKVIVKRGSTAGRTSYNRNRYRNKQPMLLKMKSMLGLVDKDVFQREASHIMGGNLYESTKHQGAHIMWIPDVMNSIYDLLVRPAVATLDWLPAFSDAEKLKGYKLIENRREFTFTNLSETNDLYLRIYHVKCKVNMNSLVTCDSYHDVTDALLKFMYTSVQQQFVQNVASATEPDGVGYVGPVNATATDAGRPASLIFSNDPGYIFNYPYIRDKLKCIKSQTCRLPSGDTAKFNIQWKGYKRIDESIAVTQFDDDSLPAMDYAYGNFTEFPVVVAYAAPVQYSKNDDATFKNGMDQPRPIVGCYLEHTQVADKNDQTNGFRRVVENQAVPTNRFVVDDVDMAEAKVDEGAN